jgi:2-keto-4-pentenoate hydratase/2-oxohepta-3-ene-1,7-dioic acid hydratase in catechol pathway
LTRAFAFLNKKNFPQIGVEWNGTRYNFSRAWEIFKQIKLDRNAPDLPFLQLMVELDLFHAETFDEVFTAIQELRPLDDLRLKADFRFQPPISRPQKILCIGRNYLEHAKELGNKPAGSEPVFFSKSVSSMIAHEEPIRLPRFPIASDLKEGRGRVDHEVELALVIGKTASNIAAQFASDFIAGYTILNDVTARELQKKDTRQLAVVSCQKFRHLLPGRPVFDSSGKCAKSTGAQYRIESERHRSAARLDRRYDFSGRGDRQLSLPLLHVAAGRYHCHRHACRRRPDPSRRYDHREHHRLWRAGKPGGVKFLHA